MTREWESHQVYRSHGIFAFSAGFIEETSMGMAIPLIARPRKHESLAT